MPMKSKTESMPLTMNRKLTILVMVSFAGIAILATLLASTQPASSATGACGRAATREQTRTRAAASAGDALLTASRGRVIAPELSGSSCVFAARGMLRHVATEPGAGTAFVEDGEGSDTVVIVDQDGVERVAVPGEVTHPSWSRAGALVWAEDMSRLELLAPGSSVSRSIGRPRGASAVFSPVFTGTRSLVSVVQEPVGGLTTGEDDGLNNLWRFDLAESRWRQLTNFDVRGTRWSLIRTPVVAPDGSLLFVRVTGDALETRPPAFELWRFAHGRAAKVGPLPGEMFLAGFEGRSPLWNAFTDDCGGDWGLFRGKGSSLRAVGCGAVMADPVVEADPDVSADEAHEAGDAGAMIAAHDEPQSPKRVGILVGDFKTRTEASAVAARSTLGGATIVDHETQPLALAPGVWAVVWPVDASRTAKETLTAVRDTLPAFRERSWIVPLK